MIHIEIFQTRMSTDEIYSATEVYYNIIFIIIIYNYLHSRLCTVTQYYTYNITFPKNSAGVKIRHKFM